MKNLLTILILALAGTASAEDFDLVTSDHGRINWTAVTGANRYRLTYTSVSNGKTWTYVFSPTTVQLAFQTINVSVEAINNQYQVVGVSKQVLAGDGVSAWTVTQNPAYTPPPDDPPDDEDDGGGDSPPEGDGNEWQSMQLLPPQQIISASQAGQTVMSEAARILVSLLMAFLSICGVSLLWSRLTKAVKTAPTPPAKPAASGYMPTHWPS